MLYHSITIGQKEYKCKLNMKALMALEKKMGVGIYEWIGGLAKLDLNNGQLPSIMDMFNIFEESIRWDNPNVTDDDVAEIFDAYMEEGHMLVEFFNEVVAILIESGLIPKDEKKKTSKKTKNQ